MSNSLTRAKAVKHCEQNGVSQKCDACEPTYCDAGSMRANVGKTGCLCKSGFFSTDPRDEFCTLCPKARLCISKPQPPRHRANTSPHAMPVCANLA